MSVKVLDVSYWQGTINFSSVKKAGYNHVIIRAGYGTTTDPNFYTYAKSCALNGIKIGVYWFCYSTTIAEVKKEATKCIETIKNYDIDLPVFYDFEYDTVVKAKKKGITLGKNECSKFTIEFCEAMKKVGYTPGYYANVDYYNNYFNDEVKGKGYAFWLAHYNSNQTMHNPPVKCDFFQYSESGKVSGINGSSVDLDVCYTEKYLDCRNLKNTTSTIPTATIASEIIQNVINDAVEFAVNIAKDNSHGYSQQIRSLFNITNPKSFDCSSLVITSFYYAFMKNGLTEQAEYLKTHCSYTGNMMYMTNCGFEVVARNQTAHASMIKGDIELNTTHHTALAIDKNNIVHARTSEGTSNTIDDSGNEIRVQPWYLYSQKWDMRLRFTGKGIDFSNIKPSNISLPSSSTSISSTKSYLSLGDTGSEVKSLQHKLNKLGYKGVNGKSLAEDGQFGNNTEYAVRTFQADAKIEIDGKAGKGTMNAIDSKIEALQKPTNQSNSTTSTTTQLIKNAQIHLNNFVGCNIKTDGVLGQETMQTFRKAVQVALNKDLGCNLKIDGIIGSNSKAALKKVALKTGSKGYLVTVVEIGMLLNNIDPKGVECPGSFGSGLESGLKCFQAKKGLVQDSIVGYNTLMALCS